MNTGLLEKHLKKLSAIMNMDYHMDYASDPCPYANYNTISYMDSLDLSDISDYEDYMVTSSDEEILGMGGSTILTLNSGLLEHLL